MVQLMGWLGSGTEFSAALLSGLGERVIRGYSKSGLASSEEEGQGLP